MSHVTVVHPTRSSLLSHTENPAWAVREDEAPYGATGPSAYTAAVNDKLLKAETLAWLLNTAALYAEDENGAEASALIAQLIREAREAHNSQWERLTGPGK